MKPILLNIFIAMTVCMAMARPAMSEQVRDVPDFGLMLNEDGNIIFKIADPDPEVSKANLELALEPLKQTPVKTLVYNIACGSDIMDYPTLAGSMWGWRKAGEEDKEPWKTRIGVLRVAAKAGLDNPRNAGEWAKKNGLLFVPSYRMNDAHYCHDPANNVHTGKFWVENHERFTLKETPVPGRDIFRELLDFSHPEVRAYRMAIIHEAIERYADVMDGFQLDFMRHPALFPDAATPDQIALITEMVADVRRQLDEAGKRNGRNYALLVRVPPTLKHSLRVGLDVETWLKRRLVDVVTPSQAITLSHDMPLDEFVAIAKPVGAKVYPVLLDQTQNAWPFVAEPAADSYSGKVTDETLGELARGAAVNLRSMGADGFELYNYNLPLNPDGLEAARAASEDAPAQGARVYAITPHYNLDHTDTYEAPKQVPANLEPGKILKFSLYVGERFSKDATRKDAATSDLRIGLALAKGETGTSLGDVTIAINGKSIHSAPVAHIYTAVTGTQPKQSRSMPPPVDGYLQIAVRDQSLFKQGWNEVTLKIESKPGGSGKVIVSEVALGIAIDSKGNGQTASGGDASKDADQN